MQLIFLVIQLILALAIIGSVLLQKNGGDGLGSLSGSGSGISGNNIISGRTTASFLTKATTFLMFCFMLNSLVLGNIAARNHNEKLVVEKIHHNKSKQEIKTTNEKKDQNIEKTILAPIEE